jgi:hypothetical protein
MPEFETIKSEVRDFGKAGFVAVERKRVRENGKEGNEFLVIARGFYLRDGTAKRRNYVTLPITAEVRAFIAEVVKDV